MDETLEKLFPWTQDGGVWVAYCTRDDKEHFRVVWQEDRPDNLTWARCKCRGCVRLDILEGGEGPIEDVLTMLREGI